MAATQSLDSPSSHNGWRQIGVHSSRVRARFASIDQDGSGMIDKSEYIVLRARMHLSAQQPRMIFENRTKTKWDGDKDEFRDVAREYVSKVPSLTLFTITLIP